MLVFDCSFFKVENFFLIKRLFYINKLKVQKLCIFYSKLNTILPKGGKLCNYFQRRG